MAHKLRWPAKAKEYDQAHNRGGGRLVVAETPAQKILVEAKRVRMKRENLRRLGRA